MPTVEVSLPDRLETDIDRLVEEGEFLNREQAVEELLSMGISTYNTSGESASEETFEEAGFSHAVEEQRDPAMRDEQGEDEPTF